MSLAERRAAKEFETKHYPTLKKRLDGAAGFDVPVEVAWDTLAVEEQEHLYEEGWTKVYFLPLIHAFTAIGVDDAERAALRSAIKKVVICNRSGNFNAAVMVRFVDGVFTLDHEPCTNIDDEEERGDAVRSALERVLSGEPDDQPPSREDENKRVLASLKARNPVAMLGEMAALQRRVRAGEKLNVPRVTLHLNTGLNVQGVVLDVNPDEHGGHWVVVHANPESSSTVDAVYMAVGAVVAVTVHDVPCLDHAPPDAPPAPSRAQVRRHLALLQDRLCTIVDAELACEVEWKNFGPGEPLRGLDEMMTKVEHILTAMVEEPMGREAVRESVARISFLPGDTTDVRRDGSHLLVRVGISPRARVVEADLRRAMEMLL